MELEAGKQYLWHGVTWATGAATILLADTASAALGHIEVRGRQVGLKVADAARFCTGRYAFTGTYGVQPLPCPQQAIAVTSGQCASCLEQDEFRFAHQVHKGGYALPALTAYLGQPHLLYIATFAHAASKVGTAAVPRRRTRLDEQGPMFATYLTEAPDGRAVRYLEDTLSRELNLAQTVRGTAKRAALATPDLGRARAAHERIVESALSVLESRGIGTDQQEWVPPAESLALRSPERGQERAVYPHDLREGEHGFSIESCSGSQALVRLPADTGVRYVLDLNFLKGHRILIGDYTSPQTAHQGSLF